MPPLDGAVYLRLHQVDVFCNNAGINVNWGWRRCMDVNMVSRREERVVGDVDVRYMNTDLERLYDDVSTTSLVMLVKKFTSSSGTIIRVHS